LGRWAIDAVAMAGTAGRPAIVKQCGAASAARDSAVGHPEVLHRIGMPRPPSRGGTVLRADHRLILPVSWRTQARPFPDQRREPGIASKMTVDGRDVGT